MIYIIIILLKCLISQVNDVVHGPLGMLHVCNGEDTNINPFLNI